MSIYLGSITESEFNKKYKNRLRDFYIYQFKTDLRYYVEKHGDKLNQVISKHTLMDDSKRLQSILSAEEGLRWIGGQREKGKKCVAADSKDLPKNPFFGLYRSCNKKEQSSGEQFAVLLIVIMFFKSRDHNFYTQKFSFDETSNLYEFVEDSKELERFKFFVKKQIVFLYMKEHYDTKCDYSCEEVESYYNDISVSDRKKHLRKIDDAVRSSFDSEVENSDFDRTLKNFYENMIINGRALFINSSGDLELCDDTAAVSARIIYAIVKSIIPISIKPEQLVNKLNEFAELGILKKEGGRYNLCDIALPDFEDADFKYRFQEMVKFFSETQPLGEVGSFILDRTGGFDSCLSFKHNYLLRVLNDYNLIDILYAIKRNRYLSIEYRSAKSGREKYLKKICYPIEVRESTADGRQYLIGYEPKYHSAVVLRIDSIDTISIGTIVNAENYENEISNCRQKTQYMFGVSFSKENNRCDTNDLKLDHIEAILKYDKDNEPYIKRRIERGINPNAEFVEDIDNEYYLPEYGTCIRIAANVTDKLELIKWLRTFTCRIVSIKVNGQKYNQYYDDVEIGVLLASGEISLDEALADKSKGEEEEQNSENTIFNEVEFIDDKKVFHNILFNEFSSNRFWELTKILFNDIFKANKPLSDDIRSSIKTECIKNITSVFSEPPKPDIELLSQQIDYFIDSFVCDGEKITVFDENVKDNPYSVIPLFAVEKQWLNSILCDDKALMFLSKEEINNLLECYQDNGLFALNDVNCYNQFRNQKAVYTNDKNRKIFRTILDCINNKKLLNLSYFSVNQNESHSGTYKPLSIEYSKRDDIFRIFTICNGKPRTLNLERITDCSIADTADFDDISVSKSESAKLVLEFKEHKNVPDRILTEFSPWEKECVFEKNTKCYTMTLFYDPLDTLEIVIRLLGYGRNIHIVSDTGYNPNKKNVQEEFTQRMNMQNELFREIENEPSIVISGDER